MKKLGIVLVLVFFFVAHHEASAQLFGIKAGLNLSKIHFEENNEDFKMNPGFLIGPTAEFPAGENLAVELGLLLAQKGVQMEDPEFDENTKLTLMYIEVPLTAKAYFNAGGARVFGQVGPYAGYGISGKWKVDEFEEDVEWGSDGDIKRFDFGLLGGVGVDISNFQLGVNYSFGLANLSPDSDFKQSNRVLGFTVGYKFAMNLHNVTPKHTII